MEDFEARSQEIQMEMEELKREFIGKLYLAPGATVPDNLNGLDVNYNQLNKE